MKLQIGDYLLVKGFAHFERAKISEIGDNYYKLDNGLKINKSLKVLNSNKGFQVEEYNEEEYQYMIKKNMIARYINSIKDNYQNVKSYENISRIHRHLKVIIEKYI